LSKALLIYDALLAMLKDLSQRTVAVL